MSLYVGVNGTPKKVKKLFVGVNGTPKEVKTAYTGGVNSSVNKVYSSFNIDEELGKVNPVALLTSGKITSNDIGKTVYLSNSRVKCQEWIIADINHDGTSGTVDLFSKYLLGSKSHYKTNNNSYYIESDLDNYLELDVYSGFATEVRNALNNMTVELYNNTTIQRHIVAPSLLEVGNDCTDNIYQSYSGTLYPIFSPACNPNPKSIFSMPDGSQNDQYWTRTRYDYANVCIIDYKGECSDWGCDSSYMAHVVARIRFTKK